MRLWAISDLHLSHPMNRRAFEAFPSHPGDWLILAGDIVDGIHRLDWCFETLNRKYDQLIWVPGNHELWTTAKGAGRLRGECLYERLVSIAREHAVVTPEDPYPLFPHPRGDVQIVPLFLLYDYSFRPGTVAADEVVAWARTVGNMCADEYFLQSDPYPDRALWCAKRCELAEERLVECPDDVPKVLVNHFPLEERLAVLPRAPRFTPWCGTRRTRGWHKRFNACAVVYGHLHIRGTQWVDGVPFQEVSLGYPAQWIRSRGIAGYLHEVVFATGNVGGGAGVDRVGNRRSDRINRIQIVRVGLGPNPVREANAARAPELTAPERLSRIRLAAAWPHPAICTVAWRICLCDRFNR